MREHHASLAHFSRTALDRTIFALSIGIYWAMALGVAFTAPGRSLRTGLAPGTIVGALALCAGFVATALPHVRAWLRSLASRGFPPAATITVHPRSLTLEMRSERIDIPRAEITSGIVLRDEGGFVAELRLRDGGRLALRFGHENDARAFLDELHLDAGHRRTTIDLRDPQRQRMTLWIALGHLFLTSTVGAGLSGRAGVGPGVTVGLVLLAGGILWTVAIHLPLDVEVGLDAVQIRSYLRRKRIPLDEIASAEEALEYGARAAKSNRRLLTRVLLLRLKNGKSLRLRPGGQMWFDPRLPAVVARLQEALAARADLSDTATLEALARRDEPLAAWRRRLAGLVQARGAYRSTTIPAERLARIVRNPLAPVEQRIGAALALGVSRDEEQRREVRVAARAVVEPRLRVALAEAARDDPDEEAVLEALAAEEPRRAGESD